MAVCFLLHFLAGYPGWVLPTALLCGARTFLGTFVVQKDASGDATVLPTHSLPAYGSRDLTSGQNRCPLGVMRRKFVSKGKVVSVDLPSMREADQLLNEVAEALESESTGSTTSDAIEQAAARIRSEQIEDFSIDSGDDVLVGSADDTTAVWTVDIPDPADSSEALFAVDLIGSRNAVSTDTGSFSQVTVVADDLTTASEVAAVIAGTGTDDIDGVAERFDVDVITVDHDGTVEATPGFDTVLSGETVDELRERTGR